MMPRRRLAWEVMGSGVSPPAALPCCLAAGFFKPVGKHGFGVIGGPLVGQHLVETRIVAVQA
jgi:hypothetical protein